MIIISLESSTSEDGGSGSNEEHHTDTDLSDIGRLQSDNDHYIKQMLGMFYHLDGISFDG
jgi:hypothetical protein